MDVSVRKKKNKRPPVRIAPIMLVATNSIASKIIESNIVPKMPTIKVVTIVHKSLQHSLRKIALETRAIARYPTAIPRSTHKKAGVRVIVAVILRKDVIIPMIRLITTAITVQPVLQFLHDVIIIHPPQYIIQK